MPGMKSNILPGPEWHLQSQKPKIRCHLDRHIMNTQKQNH